MIEKIIENPLGYIKGCSDRGIIPESWTVVLKDGLVWLENCQIQLRIRGKLKNQFNQSASNTSNQTETSEKEAKCIQTPKRDIEERPELVKLARRAGLLGTDRAGSY
jgi:hypothetical protein